MGETKPSGGAAFVIADNGAILAGSGWSATAYSDPETGDLLYTRIWELADAWATTITPSIVASRQRHESKYARDLITVQPLAASGSGSAGGGGAAAAAKWTLRAAIFTPRDQAVRPLLDDLAMAALVVMGAPFVLLFLLLLCHAFIRCIRRCCFHDNRMTKINSGVQATTPVARTASEWKQ